VEQICKLAAIGETERQQSCADARLAMSSKQKKPPPHWMVALVPLFGEVRLDGTLEPRWQEAILIGDFATKDEQKQLYGLLYKLKWFPPRARDAILQALGSTRSKQKSDDGTRRLMWLQDRINKGATYKQVAAAEGIPVGTLKKQLQRFRNDQRDALEVIRKRAAKVKPSEEVLAHIRKRGKRGK
jgi:hypothetical protein